MAILEIKNVGKTFGTLKALEGINISIKENTFHGLIGPNGSGKSTLLKAIAGDHYADEGTINFNGTDITSRSPEFRARNGLNFKFQITSIFPEISTYDNILLSLQSAQSVWSLIFSREKEALDKKIVNTLKQFNLYDKSLDQRLPLSSFSYLRKPKLNLLSIHSFEYLNQYSKFFLVKLISSSM